MRRGVKLSLGGAAAVLLLAVVPVVAVLVAGNTDWGRGLIERTTLRLTGGTVRLAGLGGTFPRHLTLRRLELADARGVWLSADDVAVDWKPFALLEHRIRVDRLHAARVHMERTPVSTQTGGSVSIPHIEVGAFAIDVAELGAPLVGTPATLSGRGTFEMRSLQDANGEVSARRIDGDGEYIARLKIDRKRVDGSLSLHEPAGGPLEHLLALPGLGALSATLTLAGPRSAVEVRSVLEAGVLHADVNGRIDLLHDGTDLAYSLSAPAMAPRPDVSWTDAELKGTWRGPLAAPTADGHLTVAGLRLADQAHIRHLSAALGGTRGRLALRGVVEGLETAGPQPRLFAADPLQVEAVLQMGAPARPLEVTLTHRLFKLHGRTDTVATAGAAHRAVIELHLPDVQPLAAIAGVDVRGSAEAGAQVEYGAGDLGVKSTVDLTVSGGTAPWLPAVGPHLKLALDGTLTGDAVKVQSLRAAGRAVTFAASGSAVRPRDGTAGFVKTLQSRWQLDVADLSVLSAEVAGNARASGRLTGTPASLAGEAQVLARMAVRGSPPGVVEATLQVRGLPATPSGSIQAHGMVDGAPLNVDATLERPGRGDLHLSVRRAEWKTARAQGDLTTDPSLTRSHGELRLQVDQLGDFSRLLGMPVAGRIDGRVGFTPAGDHTQAQLTLDGADLVVGQLAGSLHLEGAGVSNSVGLTLHAELPALLGHAATVDSSVALDIDSRSLTVSKFGIAYRDQPFRLLAPAHVTFGQGLAVDDFKLGAGEAFLDVRGSILPSLELRASLQKVGPALVNRFMPDLLSAALIDGRARLQGTLAHPTGTVRLDATDLQFADDAAAGLPAADLHTRVEIDGDVASVNARLSAGSGSLLTLSGTAPLAASGALNLEIGGKLDVGLVSPLLEARGLRATGRLAVDAEVTGPADGPKVSGSITLAGGSLRDYVRGVNLTDINADIEGGEGGLSIKTFTAKASSGTITLAGSVGVLQPGIPIDLKLLAKNAQPIASNIVTANLDADLHLGGTLRRRIDLGGSIHVNRAVIGIPESLPPDVAVLDVRRRGQAAPTSADRQLVIGLDVSVRADGQILVQGRGLDAELGGEIHLTGTTDAPVANGSFDLQRGTFTIAGSKLDFKEGRVGFDGAGLAKKIDPTLDFTAQASLSASTATLHISGVADAPRFDFTSTSGQSTDEIMAQLLFGENAAQLTALQAAQIAYALATLSGGGGGINPLVKLQKSLGLDRLTVGSNTTTTATGATENAGAAIAAGRYVSKRVYVEGRQTTAGTSQVQVNVDLTKHLKLQTRLGNGTANTQGTTPDNDPGSSIGLSYQFEY